MKGFIGKNIFNYRISIEKPEETEFIKVCCYYGNACFENQAEENIVTQNFEMGEQSLDEIKKWLEEKCEEYFSQF